MIKACKRRTKEVGMIESWEDTQWLDYAILGENGFPCGVRDDAPDFIKEQWRKRQEYIEECRRTGKKPLIR